MKKKLQKICISSLGLLLLLFLPCSAQITLVKDYSNKTSASIGTFQGIHFREAGFSALYLIPNTNGKEFWTCSDRGVNIDAANANPAGCRPTYDKIYGFPTYVPKIHRIKLEGDSIHILQTITMKRPNGTSVSGIINPAGFGSTQNEIASTDTVQDCLNFASKTAKKDIFGIDSEGLVVDKDGNFWICEEGGPTVWKLNKNGVVLKRFTPYANMAGAESIDIQIDTVFKYRKNNRGFEGIAITPNGKIYAIIQSPLLYPTKAIGENTRIHRILEIDPSNNTTRMFVYVNNGVVGAAGSDQIRLRDWKIGDMAAINNTEFLVLEAALRGTSDIKKLYKISIATATPVHSGLYNGKTVEALVDETGLTGSGIVPVTKTMVMDLLSNGWPVALDKAEGLAIINDSTIAIGNDNDYGQYSPAENGVATATANLSHVPVYHLGGVNKLINYVSYYCENTDLTINAGTDKKVYAGYPPASCITLIAKDIKGGAPPYKLLWNTGATTNTIKVCPTVNTTYWITLTESNGCSVKDSVEICAENVKCGNNKVIVCSSIRMYNKNLQETHCVPIAIATRLLNQPSSVIEWNIGSCDNTCGAFESEFVKTIQSTDDIKDAGVTLENHTETGAVDVYPNPMEPSSGLVIEVRNVAGTIVKVSMMDLLGKQLVDDVIPIDGAAAKKQFYFEKKLLKGVYLIVVTTQEKVFTKKLIVE